MGKAIYKRGKLHFDAVGWAIVRKVAKRTKKSPIFVVNSALMRLARKQNGKKA